MCDAHVYMYTITCNNYVELCHKLSKQQCYTSSYKCKCIPVHAIYIYCVSTHNIHFQYVRARVEQEEQVYMCA